MGLLVAALLLILSGSYLLALGRYVWDAGLLLLLGLVGLVVVLLRSRLTAPVPARKRVGLTRLPGLRTLAITSALVLSLVVGLAARSRPPTSDFTLHLLLWGLALGCFVIGLLWPLQLKVWSPGGRSRRVWLALGGLLLVALLVRGWALGRIPANMGGDEGTQALAGLQLVEAPLGNPFATGWYSVPTMSFLLYGSVIRLVGATIAGARLLSVLVGTLTVLTTFLLGRALGGERVGWIAAVVVAFSAYHLHFSRLASNQIMDPLIATLALWLLWRALESSKTSVAWGLAGMVAGFGWYLYFGARWVTFVLVLWLGWRLLVEPRFLARRWRGLLLFGAGWLVVALPLVMWYLAHPSDLTARYDAVSIFSSGWLEREVALTGRSATALLLQQFWKAATAFHLTPDPTFWYYPEAPLLDFILGGLMLVGLLAALLRWRWPARTLTLLWFWSTLVMAWFVTENPPSSQRGLLLVPAVGLLVAWGIEALGEIVERRRLLRAMVLMLLVCAALLNLVFYFGIYTPRRTYGNPTATVATELARFLRAAPWSESRVYFFGPPHLYWDFGTLAYLLRDVAGTNVEPSTVPQDVERPARFVFVPERAAELESVREAYPGGEVQELRAPHGRLWAIIYDW
ncbi:MAG: glycosyltransferase family 39 protein [Anaerolineales bacterium]